MLNEHNKQKARAWTKRGPGKSTTNAERLSANTRASAMHIALPCGNTAHYLAAINAAAIYIALPRVGAASVHGLQRLLRDTGNIVSLAWARAH